MARTKVKLTEMRDANVRFISLVDRAASRLPIRVLKRDEEQTMDLTKIFKRDSKPEAGVVAEGADESVLAAVKGAVTEAIMELVAKMEEAKKCETCGKNPCVCAKKDDDIAEGDMVTGASTDNNDPDGEKAAKKVKAQADKQAKKGDNSAVNDPGGSQDPGIVSSGTFDNAATEEADPNMPKEKGGDNSVVNNPGGQQDTGTISDGAVASTAVETGDTDNRGAGMHDIAALLKSTLQSVAEKLDAVQKSVEELRGEMKNTAQKQEDLQKVVDGVVQKSETLEGKLSSAITAPPVGEDLPSGRGATVKKSDEDPRKGCFDTGFLPGYRRR